jgi:cbb3-type cytochrome oxidase maturation protein
MLQSIYLLIPLSIVLLAAAIWAFFWAVNRGQFDDMDESARAALEEDPLPEDDLPASERINEGATSPRA